MHRARNADGIQAPRCSTLLLTRRKMRIAADAVVSNATSRHRRACVSTAPLEDHARRCSVDGTGRTANDMAGEKSSLWMRSAAVSATVVVPTCSEVESMKPGGAERAIVDDPGETARTWDTHFTATG